MASFPKMMDKDQKWTLEAEKIIIYFVQMSLGNWAAADKNVKSRMKFVPRDRGSNFHL